MADLPAEVGFLTLTGSVVEGLADSVDFGNQPDAVVAEATIVITPEGLPPQRPYVVAPISETIVYPRSVVCRLINGVLYGPDDGSQPVPGEPTPAAPGVRLIAPNQAALDYTGWRWVANLSPSGDPAAKWRPFTIAFTGVPGDSITLAQAAMQQTAVNAAAQPVTWIVEGTAIPPAARPNEFLLDVAADPWFLYKIAP
ncbi:hypothetical protein ACFVJS_03735 [Nocardioides sp. NPDC057772]|uniref:hypothetical protein n=1 Tax=Nocardioides sp. NPDC057772 TaxID=3346245 RepID=UPI003671F66A